jgi:hypothetical protein
VTVANLAVVAIVFAGLTGLFVGLACTYRRRARALTARVAYLKAALGPGPLQPGSVQPLTDPLEAAYALPAYDPHRPTSEEC